ncbi:MAG: NosD domain-containing protein [Thermoplasmatota archaeon]
MKKKSLILFMLCCIIIVGFCGCSTKTPRDENTIYVDINGGADYKSIQAAVDNASANNTISVAEGVYFENIEINSTITLIGANKDKTIIDANNSGDAITITDHGKLYLSGFTLRNSGDSYSYPDYDAALDISSDHNHIDNVIIADNAIGIYSSHVSYNNFTNLSIHSNTDYGIYLYSSSNYNILRDIVFMNNSCALRIKGARHNKVIHNHFEDNQRGMYFCCGARENLVYHNQFINNSLWNGNDYVGGNDWDNGYPSGGNYWDDYDGVDEYGGVNQTKSGSDGIGDVPYNVTSDGSKQDHYPLMEPIKN